jgi:hypothetical protein
VQKRDFDLKKAAHDHLWNTANDLKKSLQKSCPKDKVLNPMSLRCIQRSGKLAKTLGIE